MALRHFLQNFRDGIAEWAGGNPLLANPAGDGDNDGCSNRLEYGAGTNALSATSRPAGVLTKEDLSGIGLSDSEWVYRFNVAVDRDDLSLEPATTTDLSNWSFQPLEFLDGTDLGASIYQLRFRVTNTGDPRRFFRVGDSGTP